EAGYTTGAFLAGNPYLSHRFGYDSGFDTFCDFLDVEIGSLLDGCDETGSLSTRSRWNRRLAEACHKLGPIGSLYDEVYFQYCQRLASCPAKSLGTLRRFPAADVIVNRARDWLTGIAGGPFFLWLHLMDPHSPYYPAQKGLEWMGLRNHNASRARYLNSYWNRGDLGTKRLMRHRDEIIALYDAGIRCV